MVWDPPPHVDRAAPPCHPFLYFSYQYCWEAFTQHKWGLLLQRRAHRQTGTPTTRCLLFPDQWQAQVPHFHRGATTCRSTEISRECGIPPSTPRTPQLSGGRARGRHTSTSVEAQSTAPEGDIHLPQRRPNHSSPRPGVPINYVNYIMAEFLVYLQYANTQFLVYTRVSIMLHTYVGL